MGYVVVIAMLVCALAAVLAAFAIEQDDGDRMPEVGSPPRSAKG